MKAIIIDDEPKSIALLSDYLTHFAMVDLVATFRNGLKAFAYINQHPVDLIFLDIQMPHLSGTSLSRMVPSSTKIIFTTAYAQYAVESYEVSAADYLLKPISLERFSRALTKVLTATQSLPPAHDSLFVKSGTKVYRIDPFELLFLEKDGNYMTYHLENRKILSRESVSEAMQKLPNNFVQIHKSFIINTQKLDYYNRQAVSVAGQILPLGKSFRAAFQLLIDGN